MFPAKTENFGQNKISRAEDDKFEKEKSPDKDNFEKKVKYW